MSVRVPIPTCGRRLIPWAVCAALVALAAPVRAQEAVGREGLDVLSWNIYMRPAALFWNGQMKRARQIGALLRNADHDVVLFQEAFGRRSRKVLRRALEGQYPHEVLPVRDGRLFNSGLWVVSRIPLEEVVWVRFDTCAGWDCRAAKGAVLLTVQKEGRSYQVVNTHLQAGGAAAYRPIRERQFATISTLLRESGQEDVLQLVAGDLNTDQQDVDAHEAMLRRLRAENGHLQRPAKLEEERMDHCTWGCSTNTLIKKQKRGYTKLIDHLLVRRNCEGEETRGVRAERRLHILLSPWSRKHRHLSDHHAISIRMVDEGPGDL